MTDKAVNVLFLCTHNAARSIFAEALMNHLGRGKFNAYSAGSSPRYNQQPNPLGLQALKNLGISIDGLRSKLWDVFGHMDAPHMDLVITVCDDAASQACPNWPGRPATAHWRFPGTCTEDATNAEAFAQTLSELKVRLERLIALTSARREKLLLQRSARNLADVHWR